MVNGYILSENTWKPEKKDNGLSGERQRLVIKVPDGYLTWKIVDDDGHKITFTEQAHWIIDYEQYLRARRIRNITRNNMIIYASEGNRHKIGDLYHDEWVMGTVINEGDSIPPPIDDDEDDDDDDWEEEDDEGDWEEEDDDKDD